MKLNKEALLKWLDEEIESCRIVNNSVDRAIVWELNRLKKRIESGRFDVKEEG